MPIFRYEATEASGRVLRGAMDAPTAQEVETRLVGKGYTGVSVVGTPPTTAPVVNSASETSRLSGMQPAARAEDLGLFFRQMASLLHAGMTPGAALSNLAPRTAHAKLRVAGLEMARQVANGASWAGELSRAGGLFPAHIVGLIAAGEAGGFLPFACEEAALGAEQDAALRQGLGWVRFLSWQSVWSVLLFPPTLVSLASRQLEDPKGLLVSYLRWEAFFYIPLGLALHALAVFGGKWWATPAAADLRDGLSLRIPVMARLARARALASFTRVLSRLLRSGLAPSLAYEAAAKAAPNTVLCSQLLRGLPEIRSARGLDQAIVASGLMHHDPIQLLVTGQQTGQLTEMLDQVTAFYQEEAARATENARKAQKQVAVVLTLLTSGYVLILATYGGFKLMWQFLGSFE